MHTTAAQLVIGDLGDVHAKVTERHVSKAKQAYEALNLAETYPVNCLKVARRFVEDAIMLSISNSFRWAE